MQLGSDSFVQSLKKVGIVLERYPSFWVSILRLSWDGPMNSVNRHPFSFYLSHFESDLRFLVYVILRSGDLEHEFCRGCSFKVRGKCEVD